MAGMPWGDSRYPSFPTPAPSAAPFDPRRSQYAPPQPAGGFYNSAVFTPPPSLYPGPSPPGTSSLYAPPPHQPIPHALKPGGGIRSPSYPSTYRANSGDLAGDLFFQDAPRFPMPQLSSLPPQQLQSPPVHHAPGAHVPYPPRMQHSISAPPPPVPKKPDFSQPPIPPRPAVSTPAVPQLGLYPQSSASMSEPSMLLGSVSPPVPGRNAPGPSPEEDQALRKALEQSARDAEAAAKREEEELAKAMAASLSISSSPHTGPSPTSNSYFTAADARRPSLYVESPGPVVQSDYTSPLPSSSSAPLPPSSTPYSSQSHVLSEDTSPISFTNSPPAMAQQMLDDEALARQLMEEEQRQAQAPAPAPVPASEPVRKLSLPPQYSEVAPAASLQASPLVGVSTSPSGLSPNIPSTSYSRHPSPVRSRPPSPEQHLSRTTSTIAISPISPSVHDDIRSGRSKSFGGYTVEKSKRPPMPMQRPPSLNSLHPSSPPVPKSSSPTLPALQEDTDKPGSPASSRHANSVPSQVGPDTPPPSDVPRVTGQYVDSELLRGVTIGFNAPAIVASLTPMSGPIPNVIALPYGRAPPLHLKAPNWHDMLKLMARLSSTRLEPTVEALAVVKTTMQLRVVVNFVKVHQSLEDWHVILYLTIDHPVPPDHRYKQRSPNDPALLPYSYTFSATPVFLRENADGSMSKWFCVPATSKTPYPSLPISFPDLAMYLQSALEDSRGANHDRSSGLNRLAKAVDTFYPSRVAPDNEDPERQGFTGRFQKLFGRGRNSNRPANDERSNLVTPFYADEFGQ